MSLYSLVIDHVNGDGYEQRKQSPTKRMYYYLNNPERIKIELQILCANCNWIKAHERREFPHLKLD